MSKDATWSREMWRREEEPLLHEGISESCHPECMYILPRLFSPRWPTPTILMQSATDESLASESVSHRHPLASAAHSRTPLVAPTLVCSCTCAPPRPSHCNHHAERIHARAPTSRSRLLIPTVVRLTARPYPPSSPKPRSSGVHELINTMMGMRISHISTDQVHVGASTRS